VITEQQDIQDNFFENAENKEGDNNEITLKSTSTRFSKKALKLIEDNNLDINQFSDKEIVDKEDVEKFLNKNTQRLKRNISSNIIIVGGGNYTKMCIDLVLQMKVFNLVGIVYTKKSPGSSLMNIPVIGSTEDLENIFNNEAKLAVVGIGGLDNQMSRLDLFNRLKSIGYQCPNIIHPKAIVEPSVLLGEGNHIMGGALVGSCALLSNNIIVNSNSVISHDCIIHDNVHVTPGAILAGTVEVGENTIIGMGVTVFYNCKIGNNVIITNGKHIFNNIDDNKIIK